jgi:uncharacterized glyoxalase superfamily protein PhnB
MVSNRSVPADVILPHISYRNVAEASRLLAAVFGFEEHYRYGVPDAPNGARPFTASPGQRVAGLATLATRSGSPVPASVTSSR